MRLEDLTRGALVKGLDPSGPVEVIDSTWIGDQAVELTYRMSAGSRERLVYRHGELSSRIAHRRRAGVARSDCDRRPA